MKINWEEMNEDPETGFEQQVAEIAQGKKALAWQGLGTFYSVFHRGAWQPRVRFHKAFKTILNRRK
jgi:hypothetical protein